MRMNGQKCLGQAPIVFQTTRNLKNLNNSTPTKQELDDPMFDKHIEQDINLSNQLTQPHQTYSEVVQRQCRNTQDSQTPYIVDKVKSTDIE